MKDQLIYDETSPSCLRWVATGEPAGCQEPLGYFLVRVGPGNGRLFKAHRIIWYLHHGDMPDLIDHRDTDPSNNRIKNLRRATEGQNRHNSKKHRDNSSGSKGVQWDPRTQKWAVRICVNYQSIWGGRFADKDAAIAEAVRLRELHHKDFSRHD